MDSIWAMTFDWPEVCGGVTAGGNHDVDNRISGLNISYHTGVESALISDNRRRVLRAMGCEDYAVVRAQQVHGNRVVTVTEPVLNHLQDCPSGVQVKAADGLVTQLDDVVLNLAYADCVPVILYSDEPFAIGVLHAGWRGTAAEISRRGVEKMARLGCDPSQIAAAIGPAICGACYEVGPEVIEAMRQVLPARPVLDHPPHDHLDLKQINRLILLDCGLSEDAIIVSEDCTACGPADLFSYRRSPGTTGLHGAFVARCE